MKKSLSATVKPDLLAHYIGEYRATLEQLEHIRQMLERLGEETEGLRYELKMSKNLIDTAAASTFEKALPGEGNKRGRKSKWGSFIVHRLKQAKRPLSYEDLLNDAIEVFGLSKPGEIDAARKVIFSTSYRLKGKEDLLRTFGIRGKRGKYVALKQWCTDGGKLQKKYAEMMSDDPKKVK